MALVVLTGECHCDTGVILRPVPYRLTPVMAGCFSADKGFRSLCAAHAGVIILRWFRTGGAVCFIAIVYNFLIIHMLCIAILCAVIGDWTACRQAFMPVVGGGACPRLAPLMLMEGDAQILVGLIIVGVVGGGVAAV